MPQGYFDAAATELLSDFRDKVTANPREELLGEFPETTVVNGLQETWQSSATSVYRKWLQYLVSRKAEASSLSSMTSAVRG
jgi:hypothetical protein